jgi:hypothetical protein
MISHRATYAIFEHEKKSAFEQDDATFQENFEPGIYAPYASETLSPNAPNQRQAVTFYNAEA